VARAVVPVTPFVTFISRVVRAGPRISLLLLTYTRMTGAREKSSANKSGGPRTSADRVVFLDRLTAISHR
jgi:hypothetical protein